MYRDGHNIFAKNEKELETLIKTIGIYSYYIGIGFGIKKVPCWQRKKEKEKQRK